MGSEWKWDGSESLSPNISKCEVCWIKPSSESIGIAFLRSETPFRTGIGYWGSYRRTVRDSGLGCDVGTECLREFIGNRAVIGNGVRNRTWGNKYEGLSEMLSENYRERTRIGKRKCSECNRKVIGTERGSDWNGNGMMSEGDRNVHVTGAGRPSCRHSALNGCPSALKGCASVWRINRSVLELAAKRTLIHKRLSRPMVPDKDRSARVRQVYPSEVVSLNLLYHRIFDCLNCAS